MAKKKWSDLQPFQQRLIIGGGAAEAVLTLTALRDLARRPSAGIRGPKALWVVACVVQPFGSLTYFAVGRR
jgi:hypothetical protein